MRKLTIGIIVAAIACALVALWADEAMAAVEPASADHEWRGNLTVCVDETWCRDYTSEQTWVLEEQCLQAMQDNADVILLQAQMANRDARVSFYCQRERQVDA